MRKTYLLASVVVFASLSAMPTLADDNTPPEIQSVTWWIMRNIGGDAALGPFEDAEAFDPATELAYELDIIWLVVEVEDPDFEGEDGDGIHYIHQTLWWPLTGYASPEPPSIAEDIFTFYPEEEGLKPESGTTTLAFAIYFQIPAFQGENQAKLRGLVDWDVRWQLHLVVTNESDPGCTFNANELLTEPCDNAVDEWDQFFYAAQNPVLIEPNPPPFADAGADQTVVAGTVTLDGSRTLDAFNTGFDQGSENVFDKDTLTYTWEWVSGPVRADPVQTDSTDPYATVTLAAPGEYVFRLTVDDNVNALPSTDSVTITVVDELPENNPPVAVIRGPASAVLVGSIITLTSESTDPDGDDLAYRWQQTDELGGELPSEDLEDVFQPLSGLEDDTASWQALITGTYYFRLLVDDGSYQSSAEFSVEVVETATEGVSITADDTTGADDDLGTTSDGSGSEAGAAALCGAGTSLTALPLVTLCLVRRRVR